MGRMAGGADAGPPGWLDPRGAGGRPQGTSRVDTRSGEPGWPRRQQHTGSLGAKLKLGLCQSLTFPWRASDLNFHEQH